MAINRQKVEISVDNSDSIILYEIDRQEVAVKMAGSLRKSGRKIELIRKSKKKTVDDYAAYGRKNHFSGMFFLTSDTSAMVYDFVSGTEEEAEIAKIIFCK